MEITRYSLAECPNAKGVVVAIDVLRAFTTAAYAFAAGAKEIHLVSTVEEAFALRAKLPGSRITGENKGIQVEGFEFGNSPVTISEQKLNGAVLIQRTMAGTQGIVRSVNADHLIAASLVTARATATYIGSLKPERVSLVATGTETERECAADWACIDYIEALLTAKPIDAGALAQQVRNSSWGRRFGHPDHPSLKSEDVDYSVRIDHFDFAMPVERHSGLYTMKAVHT